MRAAIYCRVSTVEQASNLSLPTQDKACREYCARNNYDVDQVFVDAGESAKTTDRPEFLRLLEHCRKNRDRLHAVVVYSLTRFSRNSADHHAIASLLRGLGIALRSVTEPIDDSPSGRLMEGVLAAMAQFDNDCRAERVTHGMKAAISRGRWVWQAPIGYLNHDARTGPSLTPDPERAPAVREAFELCAAGVTGHALLERLTAQGLRTKRGHPLTWSRLYVLLRTPVYMGLVRGWGTEARGDFAPIVSEELFARVQQRLARPHRAATAIGQHVDHPDFALRRFVRCGHCDRPLTASWSRGKTGVRYPYYHCRRGCLSVSRRTIEERFLALLETLKPKPEYWALLRATVLDVWRDARTHAASSQASAQRRQADLERKLARVEDAYLFEKALDEASYARRRDELREAIALAKIEATETSIEETDVEGMLAFAEHALTHASALWTHAGTLEERIRVQWALFPTGLVWQTAPLETFQTPVSCLEFYHLGEALTTQEGMACHPIATWKPALAWLQHLYRGLPHAA